MKRPWYLTVLLVLFLLGAVVSIFTFAFGGGLIQQTLPNVPSWYAMVLAVLSIVELVAVVMLWKWSMMGFYLLVGVSAFVSILSLVFTGVSSIATIFGGVVGLVLLWLAMKPVWSNFK